MPANDATQVGATELAEAILARKVRPRVADIRRLAEEVLAVKPERKKKKGGKKKEKKNKKADGKSEAGGKTRKLSKIPGQKTAK